MRSSAGRFTDPATLARKLQRLPAAHPMRDVVVLRTRCPRAQSHAARACCIGSLLDLAAHSVARGMPDAIALFESGAVYRAKAISADNLPEERHHALGGLLVTGAVAAFVRGATSFQAPRLTSSPPKGSEGWSRRSASSGPSACRAISLQGRAGNRSRRSCTQVAALRSSSVASGSAGVGEIHPNRRRRRGTSTPTRSPRSRSTSRGAHRRRARADHATRTLTSLPGRP